MTVQEQYAALAKKAKQYGKRYNVKIEIPTVKKPTKATINRLEKNYEKAKGQVWARGVIEKMKEKEKTEFYTAVVETVRASVNRWEGAVESWRRSTFSQGMYAGYFYLYRWLMTRDKKRANKALQVFLPEGQCYKVVMDILDRFDEAYSDEAVEELMSTVDLVINKIQTAESMVDKRIKPKATKQQKEISGQLQAAQIKAETVANTKGKTLAVHTDDELLAWLGI